MGRPVAAAWLLLLLVGVPCTAQEEAPAEPTTPEAEIRTAAVEIDGIPLFDVRGVSAFPAETRARAIADRIRGLARDGTFSAESLRVETSPLGVEIKGGAVTLMAVSDADGAIEGAPRDAVARANLQRIALAIDAYRTARSRAALLGAAWRAVLAIAILVLVLWILSRLAARSRTWLEERVRTRVHLSIRSFEIVRSERLWTFVRSGSSTLRALVAATLILIWARYVLQLFPWTRGLGRRLTDYVFDPLATMAQGFLATVPDLFFLGILFLVARFVLRAMRLFFDAVGRGEITLQRFESEWAVPTYRLLRLAVIGFAIVVGYPYIPGSDSAAFKGLSLFFGVVFSLGSSSAIANTIAGYSLTYRRAFRVGDRVRIGDVFGDVTEVRLQVTHVRTPKNEEVIVPNSSILNQEVTNYSSLARSCGLILYSVVGIGYETPWRQVEAMLLLAAERTPGALREPKPYVLHKSLGDFAVNYEINIYCNDPQAMMSIYTDLHRQILDVFNEYGVQIMTPAYESDPPQPKIVPRDQWKLPPAPPE